ncbi:MAG: thiamine pyrophosphate-dependent enzyme [Magnetococcus sp. WYHC-3]
MNADEIRQDVIRVAVKNNAGHIAPSLSCVDILYVLYYYIMEDYDRLIISKAHGAYGLYSILADNGIIPKETWERFGLPGCLERMPEYGIEAGCGALGHGLPMAVGLAWALKLRDLPGRVYCLVGDGECQEGTTWEAVQFAKHMNLDNLNIVIDDNSLQAMDFTGNIISGCLSSRFIGFGLNPVICNGHEHEYLKLGLGIKQEFRPSVTICDTIKGYGLPFMMDDPKWHYRIPTENELCM